MSAKQVDELDKAIGRRLRAWRLEREISQARLGELTGVTFQQIQKYENGINRIGAGRLQAMAKALDVSISAFYSNGKNDPTGDDDIFPLVDTALALRLMKAFSGIGDRETKRSMVELIESLAEREKRVQAK